MVEVAGVAMVLVIVLSVFNGLEGLIRSLYNAFDPEIKITTVKGKAFPVDSAFLKGIKSTEGIELVTEEIEDNVLLKYREDKMVVKAKGVSDTFTRQHRMDSMIVEGQFVLRNDSIDFAI